MKKKVMALIMAIIMLTGAGMVFAKEENTETTVYLTVSKYGEVVKDKNGDDMAYVKIELSGQPSYTIDDAFKIAHETYFEEGETGYETSVSEWGLGVDKFWGDTSGNFGYQVNGAEEMVMGPGHILKEGDHIEAVIYRNLYPDTEKYTKFNFLTAETSAGELVTLQLFESGYDENWNIVFSPCTEAKITIDGVETEYVTDENGFVDVLIEEDGKHLISAKKEKTVNDTIVPAICAPVCLIEAEHPSAEIIHNIAKMFSEADLTEDKGNLPWIVADMAVYEELFPESGYILTKEQKEKYTKFISDMADSEKPGDMAKTIIALRSMGKDAKRIFTKDYKKHDPAAKLCKLIDKNDERVTNIYTLPYVLIALSQGDEYITNSQKDTLIKAALESKDTWISTEFGTDALTPMVLALAPYCEENEEVKAVIDEAVGVLKAEQREDGLIDGVEGYESASTGLAICAFSAIGTDSDEVVCGEKSLIDGLLSTANDEKNAFSNAFATEQGFRGLLAWKIMEDKNMYSFSDYPASEVNLSPAKYCPVIFDVSPKGANVTINGGEEISDNCFDISEGTYNYSVSRSGYTKKSGTIEISEADVLNHNVKNIEVTLSRKHTSTTSGSSSGGGYTGGSSINTDEKEQEKKEEVKPKAENVFRDVKNNDWFYDSVQFVLENKLFSGTDKGFEPETNMTRAMFITVLYRFASPETNTEKTNNFSDVTSGAWYEESVKWGVEENIIKGISDTLFSPDSNITREQIAQVLYRFAKQNSYDITFEKGNIASYSDSDRISDYAVEAMQYAVEKGIITGKGNNMLAPLENATRAEVATMIMRFAKMVR